MPSLRVLPVGNSVIYGKFLDAVFPALGGITFNVLPAIDSASAISASGDADVVLFGYDGKTPGESDDLKTFLRASCGAVIVLAGGYDPQMASDCFQCGAQDFLAIEGLTPELLAGAMVHAWQRHGASRRMDVGINDAAPLHGQSTEVLERFRFLLDSLPQIVWTTNAKGALVSINAFWTRYSGRSIPETLAEGWGDWIHPDDVAATKGQQHLAMEKGEAYQLQHRLRSADGSYRWHELRVVPRRDATGQILEWIGTEEDIEDKKLVEERIREASDELGIRILERTSELAHANEMLQAEVAERRRAEIEAQKAREVAEAANRSKTEFLANISHEIRTPMNGIIGMTELALETDLNLQQREYLQLVAHSADSLLVLINDMLDFAKIEAGRLELASELFSLRKTLEDSLTTINARATQKGLRLILDVEPGIPRQILGDPVRLRQVLVNLLGNSIKFTEKGEIKVRVSAISIRNDRANLLFEVIDTGIGIPEDKLGVIFEAFAQVDGSMTRRFGGTGLGLAIVSSIIKKMGGDIRVGSKLGEGSTFAFNMPVEFDPLEQTAVEEPVATKEFGATSESRAHARVMVVAEQGSETAITLMEMLTALNLEATVVGLGEEALGTVERAHQQGLAFRLIMVDASLGDMDGAQFIQKLVKSSALKAPVVLMLAGTASSEEVKKAWAAGPDWVLYKPVMQADLVETLGRSLLMMEPPQVAQALPLQEEKIAEAKPPLRVLVAEDNLINQIVAERILLSFGCHIVKVNNGREALEALEKEPIDLILMDIQMPEMDGMEATRMIRSFPDARAQLPIVAMTAHAMKGDRERFLASGMDHYISKPFHKDELLLLVKSIESRVRMANTLSVQRQGLGLKGISLERFLKVMGGDEALFRGACELFAELMPGRLEELNKALTERRTTEAERLAHNLRSSLDSVGARETSEMVTVLEAYLRSRDFPGAVSLFEKIRNDVREILEQIETFPPFSAG